MDDALPPLSEAAKNFQPGVYRHYKGDLYHAYFVGRMSEARENDQARNRRDTFMYSAEQLRETYDRIAEDWRDDHLGDVWSRDSARRFASGFASGAEILDVGCGPGTKSQEMADAGVKVTGIDFSQRMIDLARESCASGEFFTLDGFEVGKLGRTFDGIFAQAVLLHVPKAEAARFLRGLAAALKPGGQLYVAVKERRGGQPEEQILAESDYGYAYRRFFSYYVASEMETLFASAGMRIAEAHVTVSGKTNWLEFVAVNP